MNEKKISYKLILKQRQFMKLVIANVINRFGDSIDSIAFTWMVYQVTQSAAWSAIIFGVNRIPTIFLQPFAGAAIEGKNKKLIMVITDIIRGICVGFIATALFMGFLNQWLILSMTVVISCAEAFRMPASSSILPKLLEKNYYEFGLSLSSSICSAIELVGMALAGIIIGKFSVSAAIYIDMATFFISALIILTLRVTFERNQVKIDVKQYTENLVSGFKYLKENGLLRYFAILAVFLNAVLVPLNSLEAPLIKEVLHTGNAMLSVFGIAITVGMIIGASTYPYISKILSGHKIVVIGGYSIGIYYISLVAIGIFVKSQLFIYIFVAIISLVSGIAISLFSSYLNVEFVKNMKEEYMARVSAIFGAACVSAIPVTSFIVSFAAGFVPTIALFIAAGILDIIICICLCNKKKFDNMVIGNPKGVQNEKTIGDTTTC